MTRVVAYQGGKLDNGAFGFPRGQKRRIKPWIIACVHITGNANTARMPVGIDKGDGTRAEVDYMARPGNPGGNSAHSYVARDGSMLDCIPWDSYAAWNNGDIVTRAGGLARPNTKLASVKRIIAKLGRANGRYYTKATFNPNEAFWWEVECTGARKSGLGLTAAQVTTVAQRIARVSIRTGIGISRNTVLIHADIDGIDRLGCPWPAHLREQKQSALIAEAKRWKAEFTKPSTPPDPDPEPDPGDDTDALAKALRDLEVANGRADESERRNELLVAGLGKVNDIVDDLLGDAEDETP